MRNQTLGQLKADLRAELHQSANPAVAQSSDHILVNAIRKAQSWVHNAHFWPHMRASTGLAGALGGLDILLQAGENIYTWPAGMDYENIEEVLVKYGGRWLPVKEFSETDETYNAFDPDLNIRTDPVRRYRVIGDGQLEIWPLPASNGVLASAGDGALRIKGLLRPPQLSADAVTCPFDDGLIVSVAAARCCRTKQERENHMGDASALMAKLTAKSSTATAFHIGGSKGLPVRRQRELVVRIAR